MTRRLYIAVGFVLATAGCATNQAPTQTRPQEVPDAATRFTYANGTTRYLYASHRVTEQEVAGRSSRAENVLGIQFSTGITQGANNQSVQISVDSVLEASGPGLTAAMRRAITGLVLVGTLQPTGEITGLSSNGEPSTLMAIVTTAVQQFLPRIPADGAEPGAMWTDTTMVETNDGSTRVMRSAVVYSTAGDWIENGSVLPITWRSEYTLEGEGQQMGQNFTLTGAGLTRGEHRLSSDGLYLGTSARDSSTADVILPTLGITVPISSVSADSVEIIR